MTANIFPSYKTASVDSLIPYARNSRTHSDAQITKIAASIKEFGFLNPVIVDGDNGIVAGHGRVMAAKKLGMDEVPTIEASHLTDAQKRAYVIADNRLALDAGWDDEMLKVEFAELKEAAFDLGLTGFGDVELEGLLSSEIDYSLLEELDDTKADAMMDGVKRAIQIEFEADDYAEAQQLIKELRDGGVYVGGAILDALRDRSS
jgi:ParB-like chromosome segregation protein Spo0J